MANEWYYTVNGRQAAAPVNSSQLKQLAAEGKLKPSDLIWQDGMVNWLPANAVKGLFSSDKDPSDSSVVAPASSKAAEGGKTKKPAVPFDWANLHPLLVFVFTVASGGLFGLFYAYKISRAYAAKAAGRQTDKAGRKLGRVRHPAVVLALSYFTLGIYFIFWIYRVLQECSEYTGRKDFNPRTELSLILIFPPYTVYVAVFRLPDLIRRTQMLAGVPETPALRQSAVFLNPFLFLALPFLGMICQEILNQTWLNAP